ncbi:SUEL-type lectin domain-containing protein [Plasmodiophora brassicae]
MLSVTVWDFAVDRSAHPNLMQTAIAVLLHALLALRVSATYCKQANGCLCDWYSGSCSSSTVISLSNQPSVGGLLSSAWFDLTSRSSITSVAITSCKLSGIANDTFSGMKALISLTLDANVITALPSSPTAFADLTNLQSLVLSNNLLAALPYGLLNFCRSLTNLNLGVNRLTTIPSTALAALSQLTYINIGTNSLQTIEPGAFQAQSLLQWLYMDTNPPLSSIPAGLFDHCTSLVHLAFHACPMLMRLPYGIFRNQSMLTDIRTSSPPDQIVCWPKKPPSPIVVYDNNLCAPDDASATFGTANENMYLSLYCQAPARISSVSFASFGWPSGMSGVYAISQYCHAQSSVKVVTQACVNRTSCLLTASVATFGTNPCSESKQLSVAVTCTAVPRTSTSTKRTATSTKRTATSTKRTATSTKRTSTSKKRFRTTTTTSAKTLPIAHTSPRIRPSMQHKASTSSSLTTRRFALLSGTGLQSTRRRATTRPSPALLRTSNASPSSSPGAQPGNTARIRPRVTASPTASSSQSQDMSGWMNDHTTATVLFIVLTAILACCLLVVVIWGHSLRAPPTATQAVALHATAPPLSVMQIPFDEVDVPHQPQVRASAFARRPRRVEARDKFNQGAMTSQSDSEWQTL